MSLINHNLLIIDPGIKDLDVLINSINNTTSYILLDPINDTFADLLTKIADLNKSSFLHIGLVKDEYYGPNYKLINNQVTPSILENVESLDPSLSTWSEILNFYSTLKEYYGFIQLDWISCNLDSYSDYLYIFKKLGEQLNIEIGASVNIIGNGNWIETRTNTNLQTIYFTDNILTYSNILGAITTSVTLTLSSNTIIYGNNIVITPTLSDATSSNNGTFTITDNLGIS
jgi:hypothetical protein